MSLPAGFKVNGSKIESTSHIPMSPRVQKIIALLNAVPSAELLTTIEIAERLRFSYGGPAFQHPALRDYREKVDGKLFWGNRKSIALLRKQLAEPEEAHDQD